MKKQPTKLCELCGKQKRGHIKISEFLFCRGTAEQDGFTGGLYTEKRDEK